MAIDLGYILFVGELAIGSRGGVGIALSNLFKGYPPEKLWQYIDARVRAQYPPDPPFNEQVIEWKRHVFPVGRWGIRRVEHLFNLVLDFLCVRELKQLQMKDRFNLIYCVPYGLASMARTRTMHQKLGIPYVVHIMDDWAYGLNMLYGWFMKKFLMEASAVFVISKAMAKEYQDRYGIKAKVLHNCVDLQRFEVCTRLDKSKKADFRLVYTGSIYSWQKDVLKNVLDAVRSLNRRGHNITIELYSLPRWSKELTEYSDSAIRFMGYVPYEEILYVLAQSDLLVVPMSFTQNPAFVRFSIPCKVTDYMAAARTILVYAPKHAAVAEYAREEKWAYVVDQPGVEPVAKSILHLKENRELREQLAKKAYEVAQQNHNLATIQRCLYKSISMVIFPNDNSGSLSSIGRNV